MFAMQEEDFERDVKVVVVGNGGVGKTSLIRQFCKGHFPIEYRKTIGVDFLEKQQFIRGLQEQVRLMLWDTAGQEVFDSMTRAYYRGAKAAVLCFSTENRQSFDSIKTWKKKVEKECGEIPMALVQNKVDLLDQAAVSRQEAEALAEHLGLRFYRICVKQNLYVADVFEYLAETTLHRHDIPPLPSAIGSSLDTRVGCGHNAQEWPRNLYKERTKELRGSSKVFRDCAIL